MEATIEFLKQYDAKMEMDVMSSKEITEAIEKIKMEMCIRDRFIAQYNDNNELGPLTKIERKCYLASGYAKQSTQQDAESELPTFREAIVIKLETE